MMMANPTTGALSLFCTEPGASPHTFDGSSEPFEFLSFGLKETKEHIDSNGIRGTRSHASERVREGLRRFQGPIRMAPSPLDLDTWLPRILGALESTDTFALAETLQVFGVLEDQNTQQFEYQDCQVNRATFRSQAGGMFEMELDVIGRGRATGTSFPALTLGVTAADAPYMHHDAVVTLVGSARDTSSIEIVIDNALQVEFNNSQTATSLVPADRIITVRTTHPWSTDNTDLIDQAVAGTTGSIVYTNGGLSTTFTFGKLQVPNDDPVVQGKTNVPLTLNMTARKDGATDELVVTNDSAA